MQPIYYWLPIIALISVAIITKIAQTNFQNKNQKFNTMLNTSGKTGAEVARHILSENGIMNVTVQLGREGQDSYNPKTNVITLSPSAYNNSTVAAQAIAAHEVGHAIQWAKGEAKIKVRDALVTPVQAVTQVSSTIMMFMSTWMLFALMWNNSDAYGTYFLWTVAAMFFAYSASGLFQLFTLPVEFDASKKAKAELNRLGYIKTEEESKGTSSLLKSAAMTYVVAFLTTAIILTVIVLRALARNRRN